MNTLTRLGGLALAAGMTLAFGQTDTTELDRFFARVSRQIRTGFEVTIQQHGKTVYQRHYGPWAPGHQANIASASKWFAGAVIMSLVDDGVLSLDDTASRYLPYMTGEKSTITVRQLMSHTSGFAGEFPVADRCLANPSGTLAECAERLAAKPLAAPPGTAFIYSGAGMQIAGRVAEVASGKDWQTLFRERIAGPLGMTSTDYEYRGPTENPRISGGARSTVPDYLKFVGMIRQSGQWQGRRVLSSDSVAVMLSDQTAGVPMVQSPMPDARYGIGNWVELPQAHAVTAANSSIGLAGWTPMVDRQLDLVVVLGMQNVFRPFQDYYAEFRQILARTFPL